MQNQSLPCFLKTTKQKNKLLSNTICWKIDAFESWFWRLLRVHWTARRSNQSFLKEINTEYSFKGLILNLQYFTHLVQRADSFEKKKTLMLGKIKGRRRRGQQKMRRLGGINRHEFEQTPEDSEGQGSLVCCSPPGGKELDTTVWLSTAQYSSVW